MKRLLSIVLSVCMLLSITAGLDFSALAIEESGKCGENVTYTYDSSTGLLTISGSGDMDNYEFSRSIFYFEDAIKSVVISDGVTSIGDYTFMACHSITSIEIPNSVITIGNGAFKSCWALTSVVVPNGVTSIGNSVFDDCRALTSIEIPNSVTSIGDRAFYCCESLKSIDIPKGVTSIGEKAFWSCRALTSLDIPNGITSISNYSFSGCSGLKFLKIPSGVTSIGYEAFSSCGGLIGVDIPKSVTEIETKAFQYSDKIKIIYRGTRNDWNNISIDWDNKELKDAYKSFCEKSRNGNCGGDLTYSYTGEDGVGVLTISGPGYMDDDYFYYNNPFSSLTVDTVVIEDGVENIANGAFERLPALKDVSIPDSVTSIGDNAFSLCQSLTSVDIPDSVESIGKYAFFGCSSLTSLKIGYNVERILDYAFKDCSSLKIIAYSGALGWCGDGVFEGCLNIEKLYTENNLYSWIASSSIAYAIPVNYSLYINNELITDVTVPKGITSIGAAFKGCSSLTSIKIPYGVTDVKYSAFEDCSSLKSVSIPYGITKIMFYTFYGCSSLTSIKLPGSIDSIYDHAFYDCTSLKSIVIPKSVKGIGQEAFFNCGSLTDVYYTGTEAQWKKVTLDYGNDCLKNAVIHYNYTPVCDEHIPAKAVKENVKAATCTAKGSYDMVVYCPECKKEISREKKTVDAKGHKEVTVKGTPATFKAAGKTDGKKCSVCGKITVAQKKIDKLGKPSLSKVIAQSKGFKASWKSVKSIGGYQIQYSTSSTFNSGNKTITVSGYKSTGKTVKSLKAKKKYYVRIRGYKTINGKKQYSSWSKSKSVTTKK